MQSYNHPPPPFPAAPNQQNPQQPQTYNYQQPPSRQAPPPQGPPQPPPYAGGQPQTLAFGPPSHIPAGNPPPQSFQPYPRPNTSASAVASNMQPPYGHSGSQPGQVGPATISRAVPQYHSAPDYRLKANYTRLVFQGTEFDLEQVEAAIYKIFNVKEKAVTFSEVNITALMKHTIVPTDIANRIVAILTHAVLETEPSLYKHNPYLKDTKYAEADTKKNGLEYTLLYPIRSKIRIYGDPKNGFPGTKVRAFWQSQRQKYDVKWTTLYLAFKEENNPLYYLEAYGNWQSIIDVRNRLMYYSYYQRDRRLETEMRRHPVDGMKQPYIINAYSFAKVVNPGYHAIRFYLNSPNPDTIPPSITALQQPGKFVHVFPIIKEDSLDYFDVIADGIMKDKIHIYACGNKRPGEGEAMQQDTGQNYERQVVDDVIYYAQPVKKSPVLRLYAPVYELHAMINKIRANTTAEKLERLVYGAFSSILIDQVEGPSEWYIGLYYVQITCPNATMDSSAVNCYLTKIIEGLIGESWGMEAVETKNTQAGLTRYVYRHSKGYAQRALRVYEGIGYIDINSLSKDTGRWKLVHQGRDRQNRVYQQYHLEEVVNIDQKETNYLIGTQGEYFDAVQVVGHFAFKQEVSPRAMPFWVKDVENGSEVKIPCLVPPGVIMAYLQENDNSPKPTVVPSRKSQRPPPHFREDVMSKSFHEDQVGNWTDEQYLKEWTDFQTKSQKTYGRIPPMNAPPPSSASMQAPPPSKPKFIQSQAPLPLPQYSQQQQYSATPPAPHAQSSFGSPIIRPGTPGAMVSNHPSGPPPPHGSARPPVTNYQQPILPPQHYGTAQPPRTSIPGMMPQTSMANPNIAASMHAGSFQAAAPPSANGHRPAPPPQYHRPGQFPYRPPQPLPPGQPQPFPPGRHAPPGSNQPYQQPYPPQQSR